VQTNQILSVDISIRADGTPVARNVLFEDADSTDIEVEGVITSTGSLTFKMVTLAESAGIQSLPIGSLTTVTYTGSTLFETDFIHADSAQITTGFLFNAPADLIVGQQVQVNRNPTGSSTTLIAADRVRLRSSRVSGQALSGVTTLFNLSSLPSLFVPRGTAVIQVQTSIPTICTGIGIGTPPTCSSLAFDPQHSFSVRGPLFANSGSPTLLASKVLQH
jgi:hypothetical protein